MFFSSYSILNAVSLSFFYILLLGCLLSILRIIL